MNKIAQDRVINNEIGVSNGLTDAFARTISYLRLSLTDRCNLRCIYCTPRSADYKHHHKDLLSYEELLRITSLAVDLGIVKVRLTGGEPLVRRDVDFFIKKLTSIPGLNDVRLTTNGVLLEKYARDLYEAGIEKINISLDTLKKGKYQEITGINCFDQVWQGLERILASGFFRIKLNVVALQGINDDEFLDFARLALSHDLQVRFIEYMPIGKVSSRLMNRYISSSAIKDMIRREIGDLEPVAREVMEGPAAVYRLLTDKGSGQNREGIIGFISPISHKFCKNCNRLRLTARGGLRSCLLSDQETDLKSAMRKGASDKTIKDILVQAVINKPREHRLICGRQMNCHGEMSRIGG
ncbi:MAG: GTP 3',8-cyclase MoaA [Thermodesulfobacteriota bacterium]